MPRRNFLTELTFFAYPHKLQNLSFNLAVTFFLCSQGLWTYRENKCFKDFRLTLYYTHEFCVLLFAAHTLQVFAARKWVFCNFVFPGGPNSSGRPRHLKNRCLHTSIFLRAKSLFVRSTAQAESLLGVEAILLTLQFFCLSCLKGRVAWCLLSLDFVVFDLGRWTKGFFSFWLNCKLFKLLKWFFVRVARIFRSS
jgi:hypothetical protein